MRLPHPQYDRIRCHADRTTSVTKPAHLSIVMIIRYICLNLLLAEEMKLDARVVFNAERNEETSALIM